MPWYLQDQDHPERGLLRGPYRYAETAAAIRSEMERRGYYSTRGNLWIVYQRNQRKKNHEPEKQSRKRRPARTG
jgi:hypothetical protein